MRVANLSLFHRFVFVLICLQQITRVFMQTSSSPTIKNILVIGAYGFIGASIVTRLKNEGFSVTGLGRNSKTAHLVLPDIKWHIADIAKMLNEEDWHDLVKTHDVVINCAGALQVGSNDSLKAVHYQAIKAITDACALHETKLIQISAVGAELDAETEFMRTKAMGDAYIRDSKIDYVIFRPGLVLAKNAYGGSALLRMLAAFPLIQPIALSHTQIHSTSIDDLSAAVHMTAADNVPFRTSFDLVENEQHSLSQVIKQTRHWLGFSPAKFQLSLPNWTVVVTAKIADALGHLGWRSPLRSTAISVLKDGIKGDPQPWKAITGTDLRPLDKALGATPAAAEDRLFARMSLLTPIIIFTLSIFWLASGVIGLWQIDRAASVLTEIGWSDQMAKLSVGFWSVVDIALGLSILVRKTAKLACWAMIMVSIIYLVSAAIVTPDLWSDPLGPMVKVFPSIILALVARVSLENR